MRRGRTAARRPAGKAAYGARVVRRVPAWLSPLLLVLACGGNAPTASVPRNVVVYLIDALRAERLGIYGCPRDTSPEIDRFARSAVVFDRAYSNSPWTRTSVVSLFSGLYPDTHGVHDRDDAAPDSLALMAEVFREAGYETAGFSSNENVSPRFNIDQGFDEFTFFDHMEFFYGRLDETPGYVPVSGMFPAIEKWLARPHERPFFLYVHTTDPHWRYLPPPEYRRWGSRPLDRYDGEVRFSDDYFGRLLRALDARDLLEDTAVVLTADHGEELGERGLFTHGHSLYNELLRVPLLIRHPALPPGRRSETVRLIDLLPTLAAWLGLAMEPERVQGRSLLPLLRGEESGDPAPRFVLGQVRYPSKIVGESLEADGFKLVHVVRDRTGRRDVWEFYDLERDPGERANRASEQPERVAEYRRRLESLGAATREGAHPTEKTHLDAETEQRLRALGYAE